MLNLCDRTQELASKILLKQNIHRELNSEYQEMVYKLHHIVNFYPKIKKITIIKLKMWRITTPSALLDQFQTSLLISAYFSMVVRNDT